MPECSKCGKQRSYLKRQNPTGEKGIFVCTVCLGEAPEPSGEPMTVARQLERWVAGKSIHNSERDECCPDFSCCKPHLLWSMGKRRQYADAYLFDDHEMTEGMLAESLGSLLESEAPDKNVHIARGST